MSKNITEFIRQHIHIEGKQPYISNKIKYID